MGALSYTKKGGADIQQRDNSHFKGDLVFFYIQRDHNCCRTPSGEYECERADLTSRNFQDFSEWLLCPKIFHMISQG